MAKEQSGRNTLLFLSECGRGVDILNLFRCLIDQSLFLFRGVKRTLDGSIKPTSNTVDD